MLGMMYLYLILAVAVLWLAALSSAETGVDPSSKKICFKPLFDRAGPQVRSIGAENLEAVLQSVSNEAKELVFTLFNIQRAPNGLLMDNPNFGATAFNVNWVHHLREGGVKKLLLIGLNEDDCRASRGYGLPCYVNQFDWMAYASKVRKGRAVLLKWYYLHKMVELGYNPVYLDNDVAAVSNPLEAWDRSYDFQVLSDAHDMYGQLPYLAKDIQCPIPYPNPWPCASTSVILVRASEASKVLLAAMVKQLEADGESGWEQATFQTLVLPFLFSLGNGPGPLTFRVLPMEHFHNVAVLEGRHHLHLNTSSVLVHCGHISRGERKSAALYRLGLFRRPCHKG